MKKNLKVVLFNVGAVLGILLLMETVAFFSLGDAHRGLGFFINLNPGLPAEVLDTKGAGYDEVDPLAGWRESETRLQQKGFRVEHGCVLLETRKGTGKPLSVLITGGSTSDMGLNAHNWPGHLKDIFEEHGIPAKIYVQATGGYTSGQELLRLLAEGVDMAPQVHISYSGANEPFDTYYVTDYEQNIFRRALYGANSLFFMPNTLVWLKGIMGRSAADLRLTDQTQKAPELFWKKNMQAMDGLSKSFGYHFIGILQPVLGSSAQYSQPEMEKEYARNVDVYRTFYPQARAMATADAPYLHDFTTIFDTTRSEVYVDDCHLKDAYQRLVALRVFEVLVKEGVVSVSPADTLLLP